MWALLFAVARCIDTVSPGVLTAVLWDRGWSHFIFRDEKNLNSGDQIAYPKSHSCQVVFLGLEPSSVLPTLYSVSPPLWFCPHSHCWKWISLKRPGMIFLIQTMAHTWSWRPRDWPYRQSRSVGSILTHWTIQIGAFLLGYWIGFLTVISKEGLLSSLPLPVGELWRELHPLTRTVSLEDLVRGKLVGSLSLLLKSWRKLCLAYCPVFEMSRNQIGGNRAFKWDEVGYLFPFLSFSFLFPFLLSFLPPLPSFFVPPVRPSDQIRSFTPLSLLQGCISIW